LIRISTIFYFITIRIVSIAISEAALLTMDVHAHCTLLRTVETLGPWCAVTESILNFCCWSIIFLHVFTL